MKIFYTAQITECFNDDSTMSSYDFLSFLETYFLVTKAHFIKWEFFFTFVWLYQLISYFCGLVLIFLTYLFKYRILYHIHMRKTSTEIFLKKYLENMEFHNFSWRHNRWHFLYFPTLKFFCLFPLIIETSKYLYSL